MQLSKLLVDRIISKYESDTDYVKFTFNSVKVEFSKYRSDYVMVDIMRVSYICIYYYFDSSFKCSFGDCDICKYKFLERNNNMVKVHFHKSEYTPEFLINAVLPIDIEVIDIKCAKLTSIKYLNVTKISKFIGGSGRLTFNAETVDGAGNNDHYSDKRLVKHAIFHKVLPHGAYFPKKITIVDYPCEIEVINN